MKKMQPRPSGRIPSVHPHVSILSYGKRKAGHSIYGKPIRQVSREITEALAPLRLAVLPNRKTALDQFKNPDRIEGLTTLFLIREWPRYTQVLDLCAPVLSQLCPSTPKEGWFRFSYQYICSLTFPENRFAPETGRYAQRARIYLTILQILLGYGRIALPFDPMLDFQFLSEEKYSHCGNVKEYHHLANARREEYLYELMRPRMEVTPHKILNHIVDVRYVAIVAVHGLKEAGVEADLSLVSGAVATHNLGKLSRRPGEQVLYLHYYCTDQWLPARKMSGISHIASNHSTWDLELESPSVGSLLPIYVDFRFK